MACRIVLFIAGMLLWLSAGGCDHGLEATPPGPTGIAGRVTFIGAWPPEVGEVAVAVYRDFPAKIEDFFALTGADTGVELGVQTYDYFVPVDGDGIYRWVVVAWRREGSFWDFSSLLGCYYLPGDDLPRSVVVERGQVSRGIDITVDLGILRGETVAGLSVCERAVPVERVEVIKGAGSALYGTGALGGVINVITRDPSDAPRTRFRMLGGLYSQPAYKSWRWTDDPMYLSGVDVSHSRTLGNTGLLVSAGHQRGTGYHENGDFRRINLFAKTVHHFSPTTYWRTTGIYAVDDHGVFVQWKDRTEPLAVPDGDEDASTVSWKLNLNSEFYHLRGRDLGFRLKSFYYRTGFDNSQAAGELASNGHKVGGELQSDYTGWEKVDLTLGTAGTLDRVRSPGDFWGRRSIFNLALYGQGVYKPLAGVEAVAGLRYDWHRRGGGPGSDGTGFCPAFGRVEASVEHQVSPQVGISYRPWIDATLRASAGRGFRAPSVSEVYIQALVSGLQACPNPQVEAERSWSYEVGIKQLVGKAMAFDLALFWNTYQGLIEGRADVAAGSAVPVVRFRNLSRARVRGLEVEQRLALPFGLRLRTAYTYLDAVEFLGEDEVLPPYCQGDLTPGEEAPLPYRAEHLLNTGLMAVRGSAQVGVNFQYMSAFERVSGLFPECGRDHIPVKLVDAFLNYTRGVLQYNLRVDNMLQYHYVLTERKIRSSRKVSLTVSGEL